MYIQFAELPVFNQDRAKQFYVDHFGCEVDADTPMGSDGWRWIELKFGGAQTALHFLRRNDDAPVDMPVLVFIDDNVDKTVATLRANGVEILTPPQADPWTPGRTFAEFRDSEGNRIIIRSA